MQTTQLTSNNWAVRFYTLWTGQAFSLLGSQLVQFAIIWYLTQKTNSATTLAIASMMGLLPQVLLSPFIGTWVDRGNRKIILITADSTVAIATVVLASLFTFGVVQTWHIYVALFIRAVAGGFHQSAFGASVVLLVPKEHLARVQGFNQALHGGLNIISAPLGAFLLSVLPMQGILAIDVGTAILAVSILLFIAIPQPDRSTQKPATFWQDFVAGFRYISAWRRLVILLAMVMVINFFLYCRRIINSTAYCETLQRRCTGTGLVAGFLCIRDNSRRRHSRRMGWIQTQDRHRSNGTDLHGIKYCCHWFSPRSFILAGSHREHAHGLGHADH